MAERTVSCESCHGPMKAHVDWQLNDQMTRSSDRQINKDPTIQRFTKAQAFDTCSTCHSRRTELTGDFVPGHPFHDHYALATVDETDLFYPDGQVRDEDYEVSAFMGSRMHAAGVRCADCHDPHSAETHLPGNALCMKCHTAKTADFPTAPLIDQNTHSHHPAGTSGYQCAGCHMPITIYMQRHGRHDHGFTIPDPLLTRELGIPNACNRCHTDRDADWALTQVNDWYGDKMNAPNRKSARDRTRAIAAQRKPNTQADTTSRDRLIAILGDDAQQPYWQAVAAGLLDLHLSHPAAVESLTRTLKHPHALVRSAAIRSLAPAAGDRHDIAAILRPMLDDPSRSVRLAAAAPLTAMLDPASLAYRQQLQFLNHASDQPEGRFSRGMFHRARGDLQAALADYHKSLEFRDDQSLVHYELATLYAQLRRPQDAVTHLQAATRHEPGNAHFWMTLGLALQDLRHFPQAIAALSRVVELEPGNAEALYQLGMTYDAGGQTLEALTALHRAEQINRAEPGIPYARAAIFLRLKRVDDARAAARRALEIQPDYHPARNLLRSIE
jgi:tetratricopeptide (TPR) repeat protein